MTGERPRMLLIEDNPGDARYIRELLREAMAFTERSFDLAAGEHTTGTPPGADAEAESDRVSDADATAASSSAYVEGERRGDQLPLVHETRLDDGLDRLDAEPPDVVLLDLDLPDSTGLDTLRTVTDRDELVPVVVLTGLRDREVGIDALREGAEEYLVKDEINADLLIRSVSHAIERKAHEREQRRYRTLIKESTDANAILAPDGRIKYITPSAERVLGYSPDTLVGENALDYIHPDDHQTVRGEFGALADTDRGETEFEFRFRHADGSWIYLGSRARNLLGEPAIDGLVVYTHDVTERRERTRRLEQQRQRLAALNELNDVVHSVTTAVVERSTREEIEQTACDRLVAADSYDFSWVCERDSRDDGLTVRATTDDTIRTDTVDLDTDHSDTDHPDADHPIERAFRTGAIQTAHGAVADPRPDISADATPFRSTAALPLVHEGTVFAVLSVHTARGDAFEREERDVVAHLGETVGHAIAAADRKRALLGDSLVELDLRLDEPATADAGITDTITVSRILPVSDDGLLAYGEAAVDDPDDLVALTDTIPDWNDVDVIRETEDAVHFELHATDLPAVSTVAALGGSVERVRFDATDVELTVHLPVDAEVRDVVDRIRDDYPHTAVHRQVTKTDDSAERLARVWSEELTDRQRAALEAAYFAGFFEWPRASSGEEVAASLDISGPTFSEHLRNAQRKLFGGVLRT